MYIFTWQINKMGYTPVGLISNPSHEITSQQKHNSYD